MMSKQQRGLPKTTRVSKSNSRKLGELSHETKLRSKLFKASATRSSSGTASVSSACPEHDQASWLGIGLLRQQLVLRDLRHVLLIQDIYLGQTFNSFAFDRHHVETSD